MADVVPIKSHQDYYRQNKRSAAGVLRDCRRFKASEIVVIGVDDAGNIFIQASPCDPGNSMWLMEKAKQRLLNPNGQ